MDIFASCRYLEILPIWRNTFLHPTAPFAIDNCPVSRAWSLDKISGQTYSSWGCGQKLGLSNKPQILSILSRTHSTERYLYPLSAKCHAPLRLCPCKCRHHASTGSINLSRHAFGRIYLNRINKPNEKLRQCLGFLFLSQSFKSSFFTSFGNFLATGSISAA